MMKLLDDWPRAEVAGPLQALVSGQIEPSEAADRLPDELVDQGGRLDWLQQTAVLCPACELTVDARRVRARISPAQLWFLYLPLCEWLLEEPVPQDARRLILGVTGGPGGGKSIFCALLERVISMVAPGRVPVIRVSLDGWHRPNHWLVERGLKDDKGLLKTFDVCSFVRALRRLRTQPSLSLPRYDRNLHDPVEGGIRVRPRHRAALVEGNFLLYDGGPWRQISHLLDLSILLSRPLEEVRPQIIARHVRGGRSTENAENHFEKVDRPNYNLCMAMADRADHVIRMEHT
jgi:pantothenate kinase